LKLKPRCLLLAPQSFDLYSFKSAHPLLLTVQFGCHRWRRWCGDAWNAGQWELWSGWGPLCCWLMVVFKRESERWARERGERRRKRRGAFEHVPSTWAGSGFISVFPFLFFVIKDNGHLGWIWVNLAQFFCFGNLYFLVFFSNYSIPTKQNQIK